MFLVNVAHGADNPVPSTFTTERIKAEKIAFKHNELLTQVFSVPEEGREWALIIMHRQWNLHNYGLYIMFEKHTSKYIGVAGFHSMIINEVGEDRIIKQCLDPENAAGELEIYIQLMDDFINQGYGTESIAALIQVAFNHLTYNSIIAYIKPENIASQKLFQKLKFEIDGRVLFREEPHILYRLIKQKAEFQRPATVLAQ